MLELLTSREYEILMLIAKGLNNKAIAKQLGLVEKTVRNNISFIFQKLMIDSEQKDARVAAVLIFLDGGSRHLLKGY